MKQTELEQIETLVGRLDSVIAVKIVADSDGEPCEVHILADRSKSAKQLSRDVQSAVSAASGIEIRHNIISIAQVDGGRVMRNEPRLKIAGIELSYGNKEFTARVSLEADGELYTGSAACAAALGSGRAAEAAKACVGAVNDYLKNEIFHLYDVQKIRIGNFFATVAAVRCFENGGTEKILTGTALTGEDEYCAAAKAALDAVNRVLAQYPAQ